MSETAKTCPRSDLNRRVHNRLAAERDLQQAYIDARSALMAVLDKCEQLRAEPSESPRGDHIGAVIAAEFEQAIADALGINPS